MVELAEATSLPTRSFGQLHDEAGISRIGHIETLFTTSVTLQKKRSSSWQQTSCPSAMNTTRLLLSVLIFTVLTAPLATAQVTRTGFVAVLTGNPASVVSNGDYKSFFQAQLNASGECAFIATTTKDKTMLMSNGGQGAAASPTVQLSVGSNPSGGGGAISEIVSTRLTSDGTLNTLVKRGAGTASVNAFIRGSTQLFKEGDAALGATGKTITALNVALDQGVSSMTVGVQKPSAFSSVVGDAYSIPSTGSATSLNPSNEKLDTTFLAVAKQGTANVNVVLKMVAGSTKGGVALGSIPNTSAGAGSTPPPVAGGETAQTGTGYCFGGSLGASGSVTRSQPKNTGIIYTVIPGTNGMGFYAVINRDYQLYRSLQDARGTLIAKPGDTFGSVVFSSEGDAILGGKLFSNSQAGKTMIDKDGAVYFRAAVTNGGGGYALCRSARGNQPDTDKKVLLVTGQAAPGMTGLTVRSIDNFALDDGGRCVILAALSNGAPVLYQSQTGVDTLTVIAAGGDLMQVDGRSRKIIDLAFDVSWNNGVSVGGMPINASGQVAARVIFAATQITVSSKKLDLPLATAVVVFPAP